MRMLLGIAGLTMLWFFCGTSCAQPKEAAFPKGLQPVVHGAGDSAKEAKAVAYRQAVKVVNDVMRQQEPPLKSYTVTEEYIKNHVVDSGRIGDDLKAPEAPALKTWVLNFRTDTDWWSDIVRRDREEQRKLRSADRQKIGSLVVIGLASLLLVGFGYVRLDEYTHRRYTTWLRLAGAGVGSMVGAGWWWVLMSPG